jgi:hypothetical protein
MMSFAHAVCRCRLTGKDERARQEIGPRAQPHAVVEHDDAERVQKLTLVLVDALEVAVEYRIRIHEHTEPLTEPCGAAGCRSALELGAGALCIPTSHCFGYTTLNNAYFFTRCFAELP